MLLGVLRLFWFVEGVLRFFWVVESVVLGVLRLFGFVEGLLPVNVVVSILRLRIDCTDQLINLIQVRALLSTRVTIT